MLNIENNSLSYLDKGFVRLLGYFGSDKDIVDAARMSFGEGTTQVHDHENLLRYLMRHQHTSPFEMCEFKFHIKLPIFVMRQLVRHRTANLNERSFRYSIAPNEFYNPPAERLRYQSSVNKQGSGPEIVDNAALLAAKIEDFNACSAMLYDELIKAGVAREVARIVLPVSLYTEVVFKCDLKNLLHLLNLRMHPHAQEEIQLLAQAMYNLIKLTGDFDLSIKAFDDYILNGARLGKQELEFVAPIIEVQEMPSTWTQREKDEFWDKMAIGLQ